MSNSGDLVLLISGFDDLGSGGLFSFDGTSLAVVDRMNTTGLAVTADGVGRMLRATEDFDSIAELFAYDEVGVKEYRRLDDVRDPHDLMARPDGSWIVVSSHDNAVLHLMIDGSLERLWEPSPVADAWHPNCVQEVDGQLWVTAFGEFGVTKGWAGDEGDGAGFLMNLATGETLGGLSHPHSPRFVDGRWWVCNSFEHSLVQWNDETKSWDRRFQLNGYTRGLAFGGDTIYVGESANRGRTDECAALVVIERDQIRERIPLPCAEIYDVMLAPAEFLNGLRKGFDTNPHRVVGGHAGLMDGLGEEALLEGLGKVLGPESAGSKIWFEPFETIGSGETRRVPTVVKNVGTLAFASVSPYPVNLSYRWTDDAGARIDGGRTRLGRALLPGESAPYELDLRAPEVPGTYTLTVSLVQEGNCWFDELAPGNGVNLKVLVSSSANSPA